MSVRSTYRFARIPEWVLVHKDLEPIDVRVFGLLDRYDGHDCIPSLATMAGRLHVSTDTVRRAKSRLEAVGAITVESRIVDDSGAEVASGGRQTSNRYVLAGDAPVLGRPSTGATLPPSTGARAEREQERTREQKKKKSTSSPVVETRTQALGSELCELLAELMVGNGCARPTVGKTWQTAAELMLRKDGRDPVEAADLLRWVQADSFWKANVLSLPTFRAKYDQLRLARESRSAPAPWAKPDRTNRNPANVARRDGEVVGHVPAHLLRRREERLAAQAAQS